MKNSRIAFANLQFLTTGLVSVYDAINGQNLHELFQYDTSINSLSWNPSGTRLATGSSNGTVCLWDAKTGKVLAKSGVHRTAISCIAFSPDGNRIVSASADGQVRILNGVNAEEMLSINEGKSRIKRLIWSPNGMQLSGLNEEDEITVWDASLGHDYDNDGRCKRDREMELADESAEATKILVAQIRLLSKANRHEQAIALATQGLQDNPNSKVLLYWRAATSLAIEKFEAALKDVNRLLDLDQNFLLAKVLQAEAEVGFLLEEKEFEKAISRATRDVMENPNDTRALRSRARLFFRLDRWEMAINECNLPHNTGRGSISSGRLGGSY